MGREIIVQARYNGDTIYEDYVCGRDDATQYIATLVCNYCEKHNLDNNEITYDLAFSEQMLNLNEVLKYLQEYKDKDIREIEKAKACLEDLKYARRNSSTIEEFDNFTERYEAVEQWIENNDWSRASSLIEMLTKARTELQSKVKTPLRQESIRLGLEHNTHKGIFVIAIIWSE